MPATDSNDGNSSSHHFNIRRPEDLNPADLQSLRKLLGEAPIEAVVDSDLMVAGTYGQSRLVLGDERVWVIEHGVVIRQVALADLASLHCREFVGNGLLEARIADDRRLELIRYSNTMADAFGEIAERVNRRLSVNEDELEAKQDEIASVSTGAERPTYRCPNCGHPLSAASDSCPKCTSKRQVMLRLMRLMAGHWKLAIVGLVLSAAFAASGLGPGLLVRELVDKALRPMEDAIGPGGTVSLTPAEFEDQRQQGRDYLYVIVVTFLALITVRGVISFFRTRVMGILSEVVVKDLRSNLYGTLQRLSLSYYDQEHTGRIMARVLTDTRVVQRFVVSAVQQMVIDILTVLGIGIVLFSIHWKLAALALLPIPAVVLFAHYFSTRFKKMFRSVRRKYATLSASVAETLSGMRVVKSFGQEDREIDGFNIKNDDVYNARLLTVYARAKFGPLVGWLTSLGVLAVWLMGGLLVLSTITAPDPLRFTLGTLMLFITYMNQFYTPLRRLMSLTEAFQESATAAERVFSILDMPSEVGDHDQATPLQAPRGHIRIENVSFSYKEGERVLKNINLDIQPGEMIGLVGQTGSGKSTLVSLVCRFYDPTKGKILLDGKDLRDVQVRSLRESIGMVLQDPFLFAGTIRENIAYGRHAASEVDIVQAAKAANAHEFIMNLPDGYDSEVGERGLMLSGGEKQRISIARAILKDPAILVLDEATSAVDTATEAMIQEAMDRLVTGRTTIAIAHRLSTLRNADRLVVLADGEIIEQGTHAELLDSDGTYARLCRIQAEFAQAVE